MRFLLFFLFMYFSFTQATFADTCRERFIAILTDGNERGPVKIHVTQEIKGGQTSTNYFYQQEPGHWLTEMIEPVNQDWAMTYQNTMFTSSDKGKTWKKLRTLDSGHDREKVRKDQVENAATTRDEVCGSEELDGVVHDTVQATYDTLQNYKSEQRHKYWVNPENGWISKAIYHSKSAGFESKTTQLVSKAPDLQLPRPE